MGKIYTLPSEVARLMQDQNRPKRLYCTECAAPLGSASGRVDIAYGALYLAPTSPPG